MKIKKYLMILALVAFGVSANSFAVVDTYNLLVMTDIHLDKGSKHIMEITPSIPNTLNDIDLANFLNALNAVALGIKNSTIEKPQTILLLGDLVGHDRSTKNMVKEDEATVFRLVLKYFSNFPVYYIFGNNDSFVADYGDFTNKDGSNAYEVAKANGWIDGFLSTGAICDKQAVFPCLSFENKDQGYYTAYLQPDLKLIGLNSVIFSVNHKTSQTGKQVAQQELQWLNEQLKSAQNQHEYVLLAMHIPATDFWKLKYQKTFTDIVQKYKDSIIAILAGHTHMEQFYMVDNQPITIVSPGLSTSHGNSPAVKSLYLAKLKNKWVITDYKVFNLLATQNGGLSVNLLYDYQNYYCGKIEKNKNFAGCLPNASIEKSNKYYYVGNNNIKL